MQYADVVVDTKTQLWKDTFTYSIPPNLLSGIKPGVALLVPFRKRLTLGIVLSLSRSLPKNLPPERVLPIEKIVSEGPILSQNHIQLAQTLSDYYLSPLSKVVFSMIPPLPHKVFKSDVQNGVKKLDRKQNIYSINGREQERWTAYRKLIEKSRAGSRGVIVLFPSREVALRFASDIGLPNIPFFAEGTPKERWATWNKVATKKRVLVIGTRGAIFAPVGDLGLIIVDEEASDLYKEERSPHYDARRVAVFRAKMESAHIVFGDLYPSTRVRITKGSRRIRVNKWAEPKTQVIDVRGVPGIFSPTTLSFLEKSKRSIVFLPRKGGGTSFVCRDCGNIIRCPRCNLALTVYPNLLRCHHCGYKERPPSNCPVCNGVNFRAQGLGVERGIEEIEKLIPGKIVVPLDEAHPTLPLRWDIAVATQKILFTEIMAETILALGVETMINLPEFDATEKTFHLLSELKSRTGKFFVIQTVIPEHRTFASLSEPDRFIEEELTERKKWNLPPAKQYVRIIAENKDPEESQRKLAALTDRLLKEIKGITLLGPAPAFIEKERDAFRWHLILVLDRDEETIKKKLRLLIPPDVTLIVDPTTIL